MLTGIEGLTFGKARFLLRAEADCLLPPYLGSALRGGLGHALRKIACLPLCRSVDTCILRERCAYSVCFETPLPQGSKRLRGLTRIPHPFLLEPPPRGEGRWRAGDPLEFEMALFGRGVEYFPFMVAAVERMASEGLGTRHARFTLESVRDTRRRGHPLLWSGRESAISPLSSGPLLRSGLDRGSAGTVAEVRFLTPTRLAENGAVTTEVSFRTLIRSVVSRASALVYFHCGGELAWDFRSLLERAASVSLTDASLAVEHLERWSNRQQARLRLDGIVGSATFEGESLPEFWPLLRAGEVLHVGKGTVFGLGLYEARKQSAGTHRGRGGDQLQEER